MSTNPIPPVATDSSVQGFLAPVNLYGDLEDDLFANFIQQMVAGITGLATTLVRPAWQPEPPDEPTFETTWCSVRSLDRTPDTFAWEGDVLEGNDVVHQVVRHELIDLMASFQGPGSEAVAARLGMGFMLAQNREYLTRSGYGFVASEKPRVVPVFRNERWLYGMDLPFTLRRRQQFSYAVQPLSGAAGQLIIDQPAAEYPLLVAQP